LKVPKDDEKGGKEKPMSAAAAEKTYKTQRYCNTVRVYK